MKNIVLFLAIWFTLPLFSQSEKEQTLLWKISGKDLNGSSYLLGTLPVQDSTYFKFPPKLWNYVNQTDVLVYMPESPLQGNARQLRQSSFEGLSEDYAVTPVMYLQKTAKQQLKPTVELDENLAYAAVVSGKNLDDHIRGIADSRSENLDELTFNFFSGKYDALIDQRQQLDVPREVYSELISKNNYLLLSKLIDQMRLQPVFFPVDVVRLGGNEGLITLLRARGYKLKPVERNFYLNNQKGLLALKAAQNAQNLPSTPTSAPSSGTDIVPPTEAYEPPVNVQLNLPLDIMNLSEWSSYSIEDSLITCTLPGKPRLVNETEQGKQYSYSYNGLTYSIDIYSAPNNNPNQSIDQLMIRSGGQKVKDESAGLSNLNGKYVELMYLENDLSRHYVLPSLGKMYTVSVRGKTPQIFSIATSKFFESVQFKQSLASPAFIEAPSSPEVVDSWHSFQEKSLVAAFPNTPEVIEEELESGAMLKAYSIPNLINGNKYVLAVSPKDTFDNFQLFNSSINTALAQLKGVLVKQDVMPEGKNYYAEYVIKDQIDVHYRIAYFYDGVHLYQLIIKGDKRSIRNSDANRVVNSLILTQF